MEQCKINRIKELILELNEASALYYNGKQSNISDKEWDLKFDELKQLEEETGFVSSNSPTQNVGYEVIDALEKVKHSKPMLSLDKTKDIKLLETFLGNKEGILSWKEDGLTIVLTYENTQLVDAVTRGGGEVGSRILHNARVFKNIPQRIDYNGKLVVRGEGLISREDFEKINVDNKYANSRNLASGSMMQLDSKIAKQRNLQFKAFSIAECDKTFTNYSEQLDWLSELGFDTVEYLRTHKNNLVNAVSIFKDSINTYPFATDGLVLMYNDLAYGNTLGATSHHENNAIAFKWEDNTEETILRDIQFQVGRTSVLTPVAIFDDVKLEGTMVNKASLHNVSILKSLELGIGDTLTVYKANMIIPQVDDNLTRSNTYELPVVCPCCGGKTEIEISEQAEFLHCTNPECEAKVSQRIKHFCSKTAMDIDGLSIKTIEKFIDNGLLYDVAGLYKLENYKDTIINMKGFGLKSYNNLVESIEKSKQCYLRQFIFALGIPNVGLGTSKDLANHFKTIDSLKNAGILELLEIEDVGEITANSIYQWFNNEKNIQLLNQLLNHISFIRSVATAK